MGRWEEIHQHQHVLRLCLCMYPKQFRPFQATACLFLSAPFSRILDTLKVDGNGGGKGEERDMSNERFNKIMEATANRKLLPTSTMEERKEFIRAKYIDRAFVQSYCSNAQELYIELENAVDTHSLEDLLQFSSECHLLGCDLTDPLPNSVS